MFILYCKRDNSYCKVNDSEVIFDKDCPPKEDSEVNFFYNGQDELGLVIMKSDSTKQMNARLEQLKGNSKKRPLPTSSPKNNDEPLISGKRSRKANSKFTSSSFENLDLMKPLKARQIEKQEVKIDKKRRGEAIIQSRIAKEITNNKKRTVIPEVDVHSPTKDELKKKLLELDKKFDRANKVTVTEKLGNVVPSTSHTYKSEKNRKSDSATESETDSSFEKMDRISDWRDSNESYDQSLDDDSKTSKGDKDDEKADDKVDGKNDGKDDDKDDDKEDDSKNSEIIKEIGSDNPIIKDPIDDIDDPDLYGKDWPEEKMVKLMNKVYSQESEYRLTRSMCSQSSHVVRRLITGVFKPSGYLNATFTGQASRAYKQGKPTSVKSLNDTAKNEIIEYALALAKAKKWVTPKGVPQDKEYLAKVMSQRIGELKRAHELNKNAQS